MHGMDHRGSADDGNERGLAKALDQLCAQHGYTLPGTTRIYHYVVSHIEALDPDNGRLRVREVYHQFGESGPSLVN